MDDQNTYRTMDSRVHEEKKVKRQRVPTSCSLCRKRKIKCDKKKPHCSSCLTNNTTSICKYEVQSWLTDYPTPPEEEYLREIGLYKARITALETEIELQKLKLQERPKEIQSSTTNIPEKGASIGADSDDGILCLTDKFDCLVVKDLRLRHFGTTSSMCLIANDTFASDIVSNYSENQTKKFLEVSNPLNGKYNRSGNAHASDDDCTRASDIVTGELPVLPPVKIIYLLLNRFFCICYPLAPFVGKMKFMEEINYIFNDEQEAQIDLRYHLRSTISILLTMLRFAYLTLPMKDYHANRLTGSKLQQVREIMVAKTNIPSSYIEYAKSLALSSPCLAKINIRGIQAVLLLRAYKIHCPEDDSLATDASILLGIAIQMSRFHGFHRDPTKYSSSLLDSDDMNTWRKIWAQLLYLDALQAFNYGFPLLISDDEFDTRLPFHYELNNLGLQDGEISIMRLFRLKAEVTKQTRSIVLIISKINRNVARSEIEKIIFELNDLVLNKLRTFDQLYNSEGFSFEGDVNERAQEFMIRIDIFYKLYILYYILFLTAREDSEEPLRRNYLALALEKGLVLFKIGLEYSNDMSSKFGGELETIIASSIWAPLQNTLVNMCSILIRFLIGDFSIIDASKYFKSPDSSGLIAWAKIDYTSEQNSIKNFAKIFEDLYSKCSLLSVKFFHCYRLSVGLRIILIYLHKKYPHLLDYSLVGRGLPNNESMEKSTVSTLNKANENEFKILNNNTFDTFWENQHTFDDAFDFDCFLTNLNYDLDPFLNDISPSFDSILRNNLP